MEVKWELVIEAHDPAGNAVGAEVFVILDADVDTLPRPGDGATVTGTTPLVNAAGDTTHWRIEGLDRINPAEISDHETWGLWSRQRTGEDLPPWTARIMDEAIISCEETPSPE